MKKINSERIVETKIKDDDLVKQRREQIIEAASSVFVKKGYHLATIRDISEVSNLGPGTIYNYVKRKEDILYLIYNKLTTILTETLLEAIKNNADPLEQLKQGLRKTIDIVWDNQDLILLMYQETAALDRESMHNVLRGESNYVLLMENILERVRTKRALKNKNIRIAADIVIYLLAFVPLRRWNLKKRFNEKEIKSGLINFIFRALGISKNKKA
jgi:AcrR family transcriptional regulator